MTGERADAGGFVEYEQGQQGGLVTCWLSGYNIAARFDIEGGVKVELRESLWSRVDSPEYMDVTMCLFSGELVIFFLFKRWGRDQGPFCGEAIQDDQEPVDQVFMCCWYSRTFVLCLGSKRRKRTINSNT